MYQMSAASQFGGFYQISAAEAVDNVKHIFVYLQRAKADNTNKNPYLLDTYKLNAVENNFVTHLRTCRLEYGNAVFYPETEYDIKSKVRIFNQRFRVLCEKKEGTQLNLANYIVCTR